MYRVQLITWLDILQQAKKKKKIHRLYEGKIQKRKLLALDINGLACLSHSVSHLAENPASTTPFLNNFRASQLSGKPLKSICRDPPPVGKLKTCTPSQY